ncbi:hypothetical protein Ahy_A03g016354 [Arachis hypogaea]|uniref:Aminotransferase-like plant mobile domain-containing protein n=1 Tax=Arachis hypogaea TaxID=3818 RepID=A0A445E2Y4_ARAHY|nr:hypothetical protein Ahy_A03g016354 [Arachis hypogaea]
MVRDYTKPEEHIIEYLDHPQFVRQFAQLKWAIRNLLSRKLDPSDTFNEVAAATLALTGFQHVLRVGKMRGHSALLSALVERWRPESHTFHLSVGEVTVMLEDVSYILGLPFNGEAITGRSDSSHRFLVENCIACFGREPDPDDHSLVRNFPITKNFGNSFLLCQPSLAVTDSVVEPGLNFCNNRLHLYQGV